MYEQRRKKSGISIFRIFLTIAVVVSYVCYFYVDDFSQASYTSSETKYPPLTVEKQKEVVIQPQIDLSKIIDPMADWVYHKSNRVPKALSKEIVEFIYKECDDPKLILGIITEESNFNVFAYRSDTQVYGLGQIRYDFWIEELKQFGVDDKRELFDWRKNILCINYIINKFRDQTESLHKALSKYVGEVNNKEEADKYRNNILSHIGSLSLMEHNFIKDLISKKKEKS